MGRKNAREELLKWHERFCEGAKNRGYKVILRRRYLTTSAVLPFRVLQEPSLQFAVLCYRSGYLKYYYPAELYCALLNNQPMGFYEPEVIREDAKRHGAPSFPSISIEACGIARSRKVLSGPDLGMGKKRGTASLRCAAGEHMFHCGISPNARDLIIGPCKTLSRSGHSVP